MRRLTPGTVTLGVFAILFGLAAAYAVRRYLEVPPEVAQPAPPAKTADVVVAAINLPQYAQIREQDLKVVQVPADRVPTGVMTSKAKALFRTVKATVMAEQPLMEDSLYAIGELPKISEQIPAGCRAVTIPIAGEAAVNGYVQPQSRVDITLTFTGEHPELKGTATMTVLRNVLVLATSGQRFPWTESRDAGIRNVTVAVTPEDANRLVLAQKYGALNVALCGPAAGPEALASAEDRYLIDRDTLLGLPPVAAPVEPVVIEKHIEVWRGGAKGEVVFGADEILESINATAVAEGREPMKVLPASTPASSGPQGKKPCKDCDKKKAAAKAAEAAKKAATKEAVEGINAAEEATRQSVPGRPISTPQPTPAPGPAGKTGAGRGTQPGLPGQTIEVQVEADQAGR